MFSGKKEKPSQVNKGSYPSTSDNESGNSSLSRSEVNHLLNLDQKRFKYRSKLIS